MYRKQNILGSWWNRPKFRRFCNFDQIDISLKIMHTNRHRQISAIKSAMMSHMTWIYVNFTKWQTHAILYLATRNCDAEILPLLQDLYQIMIKTKNAFSTLQKWKTSSFRWTDALFPRRQIRKNIMSSAKRSIQMKSLAIFGSFFIKFMQKLTARFNQFCKKLSNFKSK